MKQFPNFCMPKPLSAHLSVRFDVSAMGPGAKRGMVLSVWKDKVRSITGNTHWLEDLDRAWLSGQQAAPESDSYSHPVFIIKMKSGSIWIAELHGRRYQILMNINERLGADFLKEVRVK